MAVASRSSGSTWFVVPVFAAVAGMQVFVACSSSSPAPSNGLDAAAPQAVGAACEPSSPEPCLPTGDVCTGVFCDPALHVCTQFDTDAGPPCNASAAACATSADCDLGLTCGFPVAGGCTAGGRCIDPPLPCENDAASCGTGAPVCGCDGLPDPLVVPGYAVSPVATAMACADSGTALDAEVGDAASTPDAPVTNDGAADAEGD